MISKVIHYCWFGRNPKTELIEKCINSWRELCPDYDIIEWNENNFNIFSNTYVAEAYKNRKWAFVTDYVRLYVLSEYGGIYMDTDVQVVKNIDCFLKLNAFSGFESREFIPTAIMGSEAHNEWIDYLLSYYEGRHFIKEDGSLDLTTNVITITEMTKSKYGIELNNKLIDVKNVFRLYPKEYFCPKEPGKSHVVITNNTYAIHHFDGSWMEGNRHINQLKMRFPGLLRFARNILSKIVGKKCFEKIRGR